MNKNNDSVAENIPITVTRVKGKKSDAKDKLKGKAGIDIRKMDAGELADLLADVCDYLGLSDNGVLIGE